MAVPILTPGTDTAIAVDLYSAGVALSLTGSTIQAALQDGFGIPLIDATTQSSSTSGADWPNGLLVVVFTASQTTALSRGDAWLEIKQTTSGGKKYTWPLLPVAIQAGAIT